MHILAEYLTSAALITGDIGLYNSKEWSAIVSFAALGAATYAAINSSGWVLAEKRAGKVEIYTKNSTLFYSKFFP